MLLPLVPLEASIHDGEIGRRIREIAELDMSGETYFRTGALPWAGLLASGAAAAGMLSAGSWNFARQDF